MDNKDTHKKPMNNYVRPKSFENMTPESATLYLKKSLRAPIYLIERFL